MLVINWARWADTNLTLLSLHSFNVSSGDKENYFLLSFPIPMFLYYFYTTKLFSFSVNIERITTIERVFKFLPFSITSLLHRTYWFFKRGQKQFCRLYQKYAMWQLTEYMYLLLTIYILTGKYSYIHTRNGVKRVEFSILIIL